MGDSRDLAIRLRHLRSLRGALAAALAVVLVAASASPARADGASGGPVAVAAFGSSGGTEVATDTIPGGGSGTVQTDQLPASATQATIQTAPMNTEVKEPTFDDLVDTVVTNYPQFGKVNRTAQRIITCAIISALVGRATTNKYGDFVFTENQPTLEALTLYLCLRVALNISVTNAANAASATCHSGQQALAIRITRTSSGYSGKVNGKTHKPSGRSPVAISCQRTATGLQLTVRPRTPGRTLVQVVGPTLGVAFVNPSNQSVGVRVTFTVK
jgi:hypothetical protein